MLPNPGRAEEPRSSGRSFHDRQGLEGTRDWTAPGRPSSWRTFIRSHAAVIAATDFFTTEVWTARGLVTHYTLFVINIATRRIHVAGTTVNPNPSWMAEIARNLTDCVDGFLKGKRYLIVDRNALCAAPFQAILRSGGTKIVRTKAPRTPWSAVVRP